MTTDANRVELRMPAARPPGSGEPGAASTGETCALADLVPFFKAFCNGTRASIIEQLMTGEKCVCEITAQLGQSQPLISHHLAILRDSGFVAQRGEGARTYYSIDWERFAQKLRTFTDMAARLHEQDAGPSCACGPPRTLPAEPESRRR